MFQVRGLPGSQSLPWLKQPFIPRGEPQQPSLNLTFLPTFVARNIGFPNYGNLLPTIRTMLIWTDVIFGYTETVTLNQRSVAARAVGIFIRMSGHISNIYILQYLCSFIEMLK